MAWTGGDRIKEMKFLVDLQQHTYISDKSHQEIIDRAKLNPAGYDNYLKGWVKNDGTIKVWVETIEDIVFRYWDQLKMAVRTLIQERLTRREAKAYAIVNRVERFAGVVDSFLGGRSKQVYFENQLGYTVQFYGQMRVKAGSSVLLLVNYRLQPNRYLIAGTRGKVLAEAGSRAKRLRVRWIASHNGYQKPRGSVVLLTDRRLLSLV
ncbi:MAG: hypothetical protein AB1439_04490 [candidate division FCPU426 bacterium]